MTADTALWVGFAAVTLGVAIALPLIVRAWRLWRRGDPNFRAGHSANDEE
jgi:hypothetical protein